MTELENFNAPLLVKILIYYKYASDLFMKKNVFICSDLFFPKGMKTWQEHFFQGAKGQLLEVGLKIQIPPSHPELMDHLVE